MASIADTTGSVILDTFGSEILDPLTTGWETYYTYNFCPNPSFVLGIAGAAPVNGAGISQMTRLGYNAQTSIQVQTPGNATGEGVMLPPGTMPGTVTGAISFQVQGGPVSLNVSAVDITTSAVLGTTTFSVDGTQPWQQVVITGLSLTDGDTLAVFVETSSPTVATFWIGGIQYEPATTLNAGVLPTAYVDGNQQQCTWAGTPNASASYKLYEFMLTGAGMIHAPGVSQFLSYGQVSYLVNLDPALGPVVVRGGVDASGVAFAGIETNTPGIPGGVPFLIEGFGNVTTSAFTVVSLPSGLTDFSVFKTTDTDPAIIRVGPNNAGAAMGNTSLPGWNRIYGKYSVPRHQAANDGTYTWGDGMYLATGYDFASIAAGSAVNVGYVQVEVATSGETSPTDYQRPRALVPVIGPTAFNYCPNPGFANNTTSWSGIVSSAPSVTTTISRDTTSHLSGTASLLASGTASNIGAWFTMSNLVVGQTYTLSGYAWPTAPSMTNGQLHDIQVVVNPSNVTSAFTYEYMGSSLTVLTPANIPLNSYDSNSNPIWYRPFVSFEATASNMTAAFWGIPVTGFSGTLEFNLDNVMVNLGDNVLPYGDGYSDGWGWEQGGTAGNSRSYFYERAVIASQYVEDILTQHVPLGQYAYQPVYFEPVKQYSN